ncbi:MAG: 50S ribosomal protein L9 [bacterium]|nr:50S ribosomal protein L9 [bacterium]
MKIILLQDVPKVGKKWDIKNVADGFAQNSLIPRKLAEAATASALARAEAARKGAEENKVASASELAKNLKTINGARVEISAKANEQGHLFAAIHESEIAKALKEKTGIAVSPEFLKSAQPIKTTGEHAIEIVAGDAKAACTIVVVAK